MQAEHPEVKKSLETYPDIPQYLEGYNHAAPNYKRILTEGLSGYRSRVEALPESGFKEGLLLLLGGMKNWMERSISYLKEAGAPAALKKALEKVPFSMQRPAPIMKVWLPGI